MEPRGRVCPLKSMLQEPMNPLSCMPRFQSTEWCDTVRCGTVLPAEPVAGQGCPRPVGGACGRAGLHAAGLRRSRPRPGVRGLAAEPARMVELIYK